jgi:outer membrane autotransporter protein
VNFDYEVNKHFSLAGSLGYTFALGDSDERIFARYAPAGSPKFSVNSPGIDNEAFVLGLGANYDIDANTRIGVNYLGEFRTSSEDAHSIGIGISRSF